MKKIERADILSNEEYLKEREARRKQVIALKHLRRIEVGEYLAFTFENRETVKYQIQEMMRVEHLTEESKIQNEIDVYNELIPGKGSLCATLFIQITEADKIKPMLDSLQGLDRPDTVFLQMNDEKIYAEFEPGHSKEDRISAVHYLMFRLSPEQIQLFSDANVQLVVSHPSYKGSTILTSIQKDELAKDLN